MKAKWNILSCLNYGRLFCYQSALLLSVLFFFFFSSLFFFVIFSSSVAFSFNLSSAARSVKNSTRFLVYIYDGLIFYNVGTG